MSITKREFNKQCYEFEAKSRSIGDTWTLRHYKNGHMQTNNCFNLEEDDLDVMLIKTDTRSDDHHGSIRTIEFNVTYSESYRVPVMYFNVSKLDGSIVELEDILSEHMVPREGDLKYIVNQTEHPLLFRPYYMIHPCRTESFMKVHSTLNRKRYLVCWLSTVGLLIGLKLDHDFAL